MSLKKVSYKERTVGYKYKMQSKRPLGKHSEWYKEPATKSLRDYYKSFLRGERPEIKVSLVFVDGLEARSPMKRYKPGKK